MAPSTLSYYLKKLVKQGIIDVQGYGKESGYVIINEEEVVRFLVRYKPSKVLKRFKDTWLDFTVR